MSEDNVHQSFSHRALAKLSRTVYEKFGEEALPLVTEVWRDMGRKAGARISKKKGINSFREGAEDHVEMVMGYGDVYEVCEVSDDTYFARTRPGTPCEVGLEDAGEPACHACMAVNKAQLETICGSSVDMIITRSRAMGDDSCEVKYVVTGQA